MQILLRAPYDQSFTVMQQILFEHQSCRIDCQTGSLIISVNNIIIRYYMSGVYANKATIIMYEAMLYVIMAFQGV